MGSSDVLGGGLRDGDAGSHRAGDGDEAERRIPDEGRAGAAVAQDDVEHAVRKDPLGQGSARTSVLSGWCRWA